MRATLLGVRRVDMVDSKTGRPVSGYSLYLSFPASGVEGMMADKKFVADSFCQSVNLDPLPFVGKVVSVDFTPQGRLCGLTPCEK